MSSFVLKYGSYTFSDLPIPDISLDTSFNTTAAGSIIGSTVKISLRGLIYASGDLNSSTTSSSNAFENLLSYITGLKEAFSKDYQELKLTCNNTPVLPDNVAPHTTKVNSINFSRNGSDQNMLRTIEYNIDLSVETTGGLTYIKNLDDTEFYVSNIQNSYTIENLDTLSYYGHIGSTVAMYPSLSGTYLPMYKITRTLGATGKATSGTGALVNAKKCVSGLIEKDIAFTQVINNLTVFERSSSVESSDVDGTYTITDNFTAISGVPLNPWTETFTINHTMDESLRRTVTINGTIQGLGSGWSTSWDHFKSTDKSFTPTYRLPSQSKYTCASGAYDAIKNQIFGRIACVVFPSGSGNNVPSFYNTSSFAYTGNINPIPVSISVDHDFNNGSITYNYAYDTRPLNLVSGSISENLSVEDSYAVRSYAQLPVLKARPLYQDLGTYSLPSRTASYDATFPPMTKITGIPSSTETQINNVLNAFDPQKIHTTFISKLIKDDVNMDIISGKYNRSLTWNYQKKS